MLNKLPPFVQNLYPESSGITSWSSSAGNSTVPSPTFLLPTTPAATSLSAGRREPAKVSFQSLSCASPQWPTPSGTSSPIEVHRRDPLPLSAPPSVCQEVWLPLEPCSVTVVNTACKARPCVPHLSFRRSPQATNSVSDTAVVLRSHLHGNARRGYFLQRYGNLLTKLVENKHLLSAQEQIQLTRIIQLLTRARPPHSDTTSSSGPGEQEEARHRRPSAPWMSESCTLGSLGQHPRKASLTESAQRRLISELLRTTEQTQVTANLGHCPADTVNRARWNETVAGDSGWVKISKAQERQLIRLLLRQQTRIDSLLEQRPQQSQLGGETEKKRQGCTSTTRSTSSYHAETAAEGQSISLAPSVETQPTEGRQRSVDHSFYTAASSPVPQGTPNRSPGHFMPSTNVAGPVGLGPFSTHSMSTASSLGSSPGSGTGWLRQKPFLQQHEATEPNSDLEWLVAFMMNERLREADGDITRLRSLELPSRARSLKEDLQATLYGGKKGTSTNHDCRRSSYWIRVFCCIS